MILLCHDQHCMIKDMNKILPNKIRNHTKILLYVLANNY